MPSTIIFYTLSLHDALPISIILSNTKSSTLLYLSFTGRHNRKLKGIKSSNFLVVKTFESKNVSTGRGRIEDFIDRKSTRLNSSHVAISYAVFCLKKKKDTKR